MQVGTAADDVARVGRPQRGALIWGAPTHPHMPRIGIRWPCVPSRRLAPPLRRPRRPFVSATPLVGGAFAPAEILGTPRRNQCLSQSASASRRVFPVGRCGHTIDVAPPAPPPSSSPSPRSCSPRPRRFLQQLLITTGFVRSRAHAPLLSHSFCGSLWCRRATPSQRPIFACLLSFIFPFLYLSAPLQPHSLIGSSSIATTHPSARAAQECGSSCFA